MLRFVFQFYFYENVNLGNVGKYFAYWFEDIYNFFIGKVYYKFLYWFLVFKVRFFIYGKE